MKNCITICITTILLVACAKPSAEQPQSAEQKQQIIKLTMTAKACLQIKNGLDKDYYLTDSAGDIYAIQGMKMYKLNFDKMEYVALPDGVESVEGYCKFTISQGIISSVDLVNSSGSWGL